MARGKITEGREAKIRGTKTIRGRKCEKARKRERLNSQETKKREHLVTKTKENQKRKGERGLRNFIKEMNQRHFPRRGKPAEDGGEGSFQKKNSLKLNVPAREARKSAGSL